MSYLMSGDLDTHIYSEDKEEITRMDASIVDRAISAAIAEAKSYLQRFDLVKIFGAADVEPEFEDENLKNKVKDITVWQLCKLGHPNIKIEMARSCYEDAIKWLTLVQKGAVSPGLPMPVDDPATSLDESSGLQWSSNSKRNNHF
jgi:phage gp36-like protein